MYYTISRTNLEDTWVVRYIRLLTIFLDYTSYLKIFFKVTNVFLNALT